MRSPLLNIFRDEGIPACNRFSTLDQAVCFPKEFKPAPKASVGRTHVSHVCRIVEIEDHRHPAKRRQQPFDNCRAEYHRLALHEKKIVTACPNNIADPSQGRPQHREDLRGLSAASVQHRELLACKEWTYRQIDAACSQRLDKLRNTKPRRRRLDRKRAQREHAHPIWSWRIQSLSARILRESPRQRRS